MRYIFLIMKTKGIKYLIIVLFSLLFLCSCPFLDCPFDCYIDHAKTDSEYSAGSGYVNVYYTLVNKSDFILSNITVTIIVKDIYGNSYSDTILPKMLAGRGDSYSGVLSISIGGDYEPGSARADNPDWTEY